MIVQEQDKDEDENKYLLKVSTEEMSDQIYSLIDQYMACI